VERNLHSFYFTFRGAGEYVAENAKADYMAGMKRKDIAEKYGVSINTVDSWKKRHGWSKMVHHLAIKTLRDMVHL